MIYLSYLASVEQIRKNHVFERIDQFSLYVCIHMTGAHFSFAGIETFELKEYIEFGFSDELLEQKSNYFVQSHS